MDDEVFPGEAQMLQMFNQTGAMIQESLLPPKWEYRLCLWDEVNPAAKEGWEVHPSGPWPILTAWTDPESGEQRTQPQPGYLMVRKRSVADDAAEMIAGGMPAELAEMIAGGMPAELAEGIADGSIPVFEYPNEAEGS
jgi:hypothetical protein